MIVSDVHGIFASDIEQAIAPLEPWAKRCHEASLAVIRSGVLSAPARVARGVCRNVGGQHSWVVVGEPGGGLPDVYSLDALIVDPTLWSYDPDFTGVQFFTARDGKHSPHGAGSIWAWGRPHSAADLGEEPMELTPRKPWSEAAQAFLNMLGPLGKRGWIELAHAPVEGWPAGEIIDAMCESGLGVTVPIDRIGMLTDRNPEGLYW